MGCVKTVFKTNCSVRGTKSFADTWFKIWAGDPKEYSWGAVNMKEAW